jgi:predicted metal-dependent phosphoesterase TrpH
MKPIAFEAPGRFWRGNLHTHSTLSDGALEPGEVCRRYQAEGYDFISLTDHFAGIYNYPITDTTPYRANGFTTLLGAEMHCGAMENGAIWHILAVGLPADFAPTNTPHFRPIADQETGPEIARRCVEAGAFVAIAHPQWSGLTLADARSIESAHAVEVYNHGCVIGADRPEGFYTAEQLLAEGRRIDMIATDDAHFNEPDHFGGWIMVKAAQNTPEALLEALKAGSYYSSLGPQLFDVEISKRYVTLHCTAVVSGFVMGHQSAASVLHGHSMTEVVLPLDRVAGSPWIRVSVIDAGGKRAWSNPIWLE